MACAGLHSLALAIYGIPRMKVFNDEPRIGGSNVLVCCCKVRCKCYLSFLFHGIRFSSQLDVPLVDKKQKVVVASLTGWHFIDYEAANLSAIGRRLLGVDGKGFMKATTAGGSG